jgi:PPOX class probable F420-dependent enzyme
VADLAALRRVAAEDPFAVVATTRADGSIQSSVVTGGVMVNPAGSGDVVVFVARGSSVKLRNLRARPRAAVVFRSGGQWMAVEGPATIIGADDPPGGSDPEQVRLLLREVFAAAGGTHDDWDEFDRVMADEQRAAVLVTPERVTTN